MSELRNELKKKLTQIVNNVASNSSLEEAYDDVGSRLEFIFKIWDDLKYLLVLFEPEEDYEYTDEDFDLIWSEFYEDYLEIESKFIKNA